MAKTPLFTVFRAVDVFLKLQKPCKHHHFLRKCCNLQCFLFCFQKHWYLQCFVKYGYLQHFLWLLQKTLKRKNAVIYNILLISKSWKSSEKCVKTAFFPILGTLEMGGDYALGDAYERPGFRPKSSPPAESSVEPAEPNLTVIHWKTWRFPTRFDILESASARCWISLVPSKYLDRAISCHFHICENHWKPMPVDHT